MKLFEVLVGNYSLYIVANNEEHAREQLATMESECFKRLAEPQITGSVLCEADLIRFEEHYH
ncbi:MULTISPECIES: hypothetical protein [unclassified Serratia (in: enterobacteria)]|uniref:hypothetical protein n=1 Tax=unclassified Serratia (in: enterobacteria) TaxID=2647522 RepID=UPI002ED1223F|nr:hypothetical protein [Serratia sp. C2(2)]MEE4445762.1 hypothetical protein [Serratia sp. C2(1)]